MQESLLKGVHMDPRTTDPRFPDRPTHPDFIILSEAVQAIDKKADSGVEVHNIVSGDVDVDSLTYLAQNRAGMALQSLRGVDITADRLASIIGGAIIDGFKLGVEFQKVKSK